MSRAAAHVFWLTGLSAAGKTTLAQGLEQQLNANCQRCVVLDGDELRRGLCSDLGMDEQGRRENIRRAGEVALLLHRAGLHVICAFVSPVAEDRRQVRHLFDAASFTQVYVSTSLEECMRRDPKGLYGKAKRGELDNLTGWDAPYEVPLQAEFNYDSERMDRDAMINALLQRIDR